MTHKARSPKAASRRDAVVRVPSRTFVLGDAISAAVTVELGRLVPLSGRYLPVLWVRGERDAIRRFERRATDDDTIRSLTPVETPGDSALYRVEWAAAASPLSEAFQESDVLVRRVESQGNEWCIRLLSLEPRSLSVFGQQCADRDIPFTIDRLSSTCPPDETVQAELTPPQEEALQVAREQGYFDVPRGTTLDELGAELGISRQAVSLRLRRGIHRLVESAFSTTGSQPSGERRAAGSTRSP